MISHPSIRDIDFERLYREHMAAVGRPKPASVWDERAVNMTLAPSDDGYVAAFVRHMALDGCSSLLDVGCGPGHIALAVAARVPQVYGLDYSRGMLDRLMANAQSQGAHGVQALHRSWDEDWADVPVCDVVVASRSTLVRDMGDALRKLNAKARRHVYVSSLVGGQFQDPAALQARGLPVPAAQPDYIYMVNILYAMGIHAEVRFIDNDAARAKWALLSWAPRSGA